MKKLFCFLVFLLNLLATPMTFADTSQTKTEKKILFICTGNYYRSRFAEALFNFSMQNNNAGWKAYSRGLNIAALSTEQRKVPVSPYTVKELQRLQIPLSFVEGNPTQLIQNDIDQSDMIIALSRDEHQPLLEKGYSNLSKIQYWTVEDMDKSSAEKALGAIQTQVKKLVHKLSHK